MLQALARCIQRLRQWLVLASVTAAGAAQDTAGAGQVSTTRLAVERGASSTCPGEHGLPAHATFTVCVGNAHVTALRATPLSTRHSVLRALCCDRPKNSKPSNQAARESSPERDDDEKCKRVILPSPHATDQQSLEGWLQATSGFYIT